MLGWDFLMYFCGFLTILISNILLEREGIGLFVIYHSCVILVVETGANNSELILKRFSVKDDYSLWGLFFPKETYNLLDKIYLLCSILSTSE